MGNVFSIVNKNQVDTFFHYLNSVDPCIKFTKESPDTEGSIPFLGSKYLPNKDHSIQTSVYRKPTFTDQYLDISSSHPISNKKSVVSAIVYRAKNVCSIPEIVIKEMDYLQQVCLKTLLRLDH